MILLARRGLNKLLILYTLTSRGSLDIRQNHVNNWKATINMSFSDVVCWLNFSFCDKGKAKIF
jgi:hypothetical protein